MQRSIPWAPKLLLPRPSHSTSRVHIPYETRDWSGARCRLESSPAAGAMTQGPASAADRSHVGIPSRGSDRTSAIVMTLNGFQSVGKDSQQFSDCFGCQHWAYTGDARAVRIRPTGSPSAHAQVATAIGDPIKAIQHDARIGCPICSDGRRCSVPVVR